MRTEITTKEIVAKLRANGGKYRLWHLEHGFVHNRNGMSDIESQNRWTIQDFTNKISDDRKDVVFFFGETARARDSRGRFISTEQVIIDSVCREMLLDLEVAGPAEFDACKKLAKAGWRKQ